METKRIKEHSLYKYANDVKQICTHLFTKTPINYLALCRAYKNGAYAGLLSDNKFAEFYLKNDYQDIGVERQVVLQVSTDFVWNMTMFPPPSKKIHALYEAMIQLGHGSGIIIPVEETAEYKEGFIITTDHAADSNDSYLLENIPLLKNFILYFKEKLQTNKEINKAFNIKYQCKLPDTLPINIPDNPNIKFAIKKYYLGGSFKDIAFTKREAECLKHLFNGKTAKEIAQILTLSPRTIESHFEKIKSKTHCTTLHELCKKLEKCNLLDGIL